MSLDHPYILRKDSYDGELTTAKIFLVSFMSIINVFMFLGNLLSIVTICSTPRLRNQVSYWFVINLAIIDFLISITVVPINTIWEYYGTWPFSYVTCRFFTFADIAFSTISAYSIVLVSIDKYIYITYSIHYFEKMTRKIALILIIGVWFFVSIFATISLVTEVGTDDNFKDHFLRPNNETNTCIFVMTDTYVIPSAILSFFLPFLILCFTSTRIVCIASRHIRKIHSVAQIFTSSSESDSELGKATQSNKPPAVQVISMTHLSPETPPHTPPHNENHAHIDEITVQTPSENHVHNGSERKMVPNGASTNMSSHSSSHDSEFTNLSFQHRESPEVKTILEPILEHLKENDCCATNENSERKPRSESLPSYIFTKRNSSHVRRSSSCKTSFSLQDGENLSLRLKSSESIKSSRVSLISTKKSQYCKLFGTVTIVIVCFIVMFAPFNIALVFDVWCHCIEAWVYEDVLAVLYYMHSLVNPYIYMATDRKYKAALKTLWNRVKKKAESCKQSQL